MHRCPSSGADDEAFAVVRAASGWQEGIFPILGGWLEQGAKLDSLVSIVQYERGLIEESSRPKE